MRARPRSPLLPSLDSTTMNNSEGRMDKHNGHVSRAGVGGCCWQHGAVAQGPGEESRHGQTAWGRRAAHGSVPPKWAQRFPPRASVLALPDALGQGELSLSQRTPVGPPRLFLLPPTYRLYPGVLQKAGTSPPLGHQGSPRGCLAQVEVGGASDR